MGRRGRPPHPDILTPRQWEVLDLLRDGLSDQEIADRLEISLSGAKHHVSDILSRLGVATRGAAAAWQPTAPRRSWWERAVLLSVAWKAAAVVVVLAASVGIGVLAWGVSQESTKPASASVFEDLHLPDPVSAPSQSREEMLAIAAQWGDVRAVDMQVSTSKAISESINTLNVERDQSTAWLIRARLVGAERCYAPCSGPFTAEEVNSFDSLFQIKQVDTPVIACRTVTRVFRDSSPPSPPSIESFGVSDPLPDSECVIP